MLLLSNFAVTVQTCLAQSDNGHFFRVGSFPEESRCHCDSAFPLSGVTFDDTSSMKFFFKVKHAVEGH